MSTIAKVMVVLILVLSVAFAVVSGQLFAKREKLRDDYDTLQKTSQESTTKLTKEKEQLAADKSKLQEDLGKANNEIEGHKKDKEHLTKDNATQKEQITNKDSQLAALTTTIGQLNDNVKNKDDRLAAMEKDLNGTREQLRGAQEQAREKELAANKLAQQAKEATEKQKELEVALKDARTQLEMIKTKGAQFDASTQQVQAPVDALVIKVDRNANLVVINKGREQGVEIGYVFTLYRGDAYLGDLKIENVAATVAAGSPVVGTAIGSIREGDNASTRIR